MPRPARPRSDATTAAGADTNFEFTDLVDRRTEFGGAKVALVVGRPLGELAELVAKLARNHDLPRRLGDEQ
jgi:hypothetical protein